MRRLIVLVLMSAGAAAALRRWRSSRDDADVWREATSALHSR